MDHQFWGIPIYGNFHLSANSSELPTLIHGTRQSHFDRDSYVYYIYICIISQDHAFMDGFYHVQKNYIGGNRLMAHPEVSWNRGDL